MKSSCAGLPLNSGYEMELTITAYISRIEQVKFVRDDWGKFHRISNCWLPHGSYLKVFFITVHLKKRLKTIHARANAHLPRE